MRKLYIILFINVLGRFFSDTKIKTQNQPINLEKPLEQLSFDTKFDRYDFKKLQITSNKYSNDIGFPEWIGI